MKNMQFFGSTTVGERGQLVIPSEARAFLSLEKGEKLLVFAMDNDSIILSKLSRIKIISEEIEKRQQEFKKILKES